MGQETAEVTQKQKLFNIKDGVGYLRDLGAKRATPWFLRHLIASGQIPHIRIGKEFIVSKNALDSWLDRSEKKRR